MQLGAFVEIAPFFKKLLDLYGDCVLCVSDLTTYLYSEWSPAFDLGVREGQLIKEGSTIAEAMKLMKPLKRSMDKSLYGIPYIALAAPLIDEKDQVCGAIVCCISTEQQEKLFASAHELSAMMEQLSVTSETFARNAEALANTNMGIVTLTKALDDQMEKIQSVNRLMTEIAGQTNLIGLNASIEAAHAGEHGRSFSVVAGEVRRLANESQASAAQVKENVSQIQQCTKDILRQAELIASAGQEQSAGAQELSGIVHQINKLAGMLSDLAR